MNKKSAIATAGGLVASFAAGVTAVSFNWGLGTPTAASTTTPTVTPSQAAKVKPIVKHRTIRVHKKPKRPKPVSASPPRTVTYAAAPSSSSHYSNPAAHSSGSHGGGSEGSGSEGSDGEGGGEGGD